MKLEDIITKKIIYMDINSSIKDASTIMKQYNIGFLPISDNNKIIGVLTDRDIVINVIESGIDINSSLNSYITKKVINVDIISSIDDCLKIMGQNKIKRLIVTSDNKVEGILSLADIINHNDNNELLIDTLKNIFSINTNYSDYNPKINEFYL